MHLEALWTSKRKGECVTKNVKGSDEAPTPRAPSENVGPYLLPLPPTSISKVGTGQIASSTVLFYSCAHHSRLCVYLLARWGRPHTTGTDILSTL